MSNGPDNFVNELWEAFRFCATEAYLLRAFVEYLRSWPDPPEKKQIRLQNWQREIGLQLGNPEIAERAEIIQKLRDAPPEIRQQVLELALNEAHSLYFGQP